MAAAANDATRPLLPANKDKAAPSGGPAWLERPTKHALFLFVPDDVPSQHIVQLLEVALVDHGLKLLQLSANSAGKAVRADGKAGCSLSFTTGRHSVQGEPCWPAAL